MSRLPIASDFPGSITLTIVPPPAKQTPANVLILLHGLGDTHVPFASLARQLNLPYTCTISVCAPTPVPALMTGSDRPSFTWGDDVAFDQTTGELDMDAGFEATGRMVFELMIMKSLIGTCGFKTRDINLMGWGQGGMAALFLASMLKKEEEFGGVISIGGKLPATAKGKDGNRKGKTPILLLGGSRSKAITKTAVTDIKLAFADVEYVKWAKEGDGMPSNKDEMLPLMRFWARRLGSRSGVPEGAVEVGR